MLQTHLLMFASRVLQAVFRSRSRGSAMMNPQLWVCPVVSRSVEDYSIFGGNSAYGLLLRSISIPMSLLLRFRPRSSIPGGVSRSNALGVLLGRLLLDIQLIMRPLLFW